ncbi:MAG: hydrogenase maturation nickel metallochaperone HypA [Gammaproteobacteria bacterium RIFCSPHIGHO2_02_FULL_42_13]|nr:MAG: hydrogenase maturation nickel metallochaperone HypA [Gammaproteobacteria bacterium RIFCSPHIGHO2_02_FULL_42_13]OGT68632.1 MAG: hydrogenase maturation nickel metallochaperone HypA [Gammaproteobacteria bacterium RIFCSPLOWO2_02_FULL_42_9]
MHEFSIIQDILKTIEQTAVKNNLKKINKATLEIGQMRQCIPEFLQFAFETLAKDTIASGSKLIIREIPVKALCVQCKKEFKVIGDSYCCPHCDSVELDILSGKEIILSSIDGD